MPSRFLVLFLSLLTISCPNPYLRAQMEKEGVSKITCDAILSKPLIPEPTLDPAFAPDCDSSSYYFGIGRPRDLVAARKCAYVERANPTTTQADMFYGPGILSMIYANGQGTPLDYALATRFTCEDNWAAPAELEDRLNILKQDETTQKPHPFDLCDTATSGLSEGTCASIDTRLHEVKRLNTLHFFSDKLPPDALPAFRALQSAEDTFDQLRSSNEVDLSGTGRAAFELMEQDKLRDQFVINLKRFSAPSITSPVSLPTADRRLNAAYTRVRQALPSADEQSNAATSPDGTITFDVVQKTQRAWLALRDAWVAFAKASHSRATPDQVAAILTVQRAHQLESLAQ
jgi:uncharacterized protein YecT (DUF1311 family)